MHLLDSDYDEELLVRRPDETVCAIGEKQFQNHSRDFRHFHMTKIYIGGKGGGRGGGQDNGVQKISMGGNSGGRASKRLSGVEKC